MSLYLVAALYVFILAVSPVIPVEILLAAAFFLSTHGLATGYEAWAGAAFGLAIIVSTLIRRRTSSDREPDGEPARGEWPFTPPVGLFVGVFLLLAVVSLAWTPLPEIGAKKLGDFIFRVVVPVWAIVYLGRRGQIRPRLILTLIWIGAGAVSVLAVVINLRSGLSLGGDLRLRVPGFHPLALAQICAVGLVLSFFAPRFVTVDKRARILIGITSGVVLVLSASKGPLIAAVIGLGTGLLLEALRRFTHNGLSFAPLLRWAIFTAGGTGFLALLGVNVISLVPARLLPSYYSDASGRTQSVSARELLWQEAATRWFDQPLFGRGIAASHESSVVSIFSGEQLAVYPHNFLLEILGEFGLFAGVSVLTLILTLFWRFRHDKLRIAMLLLLVCNATVSGGLADHRILIPFAAAALLTLPHQPESGGTWHDRRSLRGGGFGWKEGEHSTPRVN